MKHWNSTFYDQKHDYVSAYGENLISLLTPQPGEKILDIGCGTGDLTNTIAQSGASVVGIDSSPEMIERAQTKYPHIRFQQTDARNFSFPTQFDAIFSNAALHWIPEADKVVTCMERALKPHGKLVIEFGGKGNVATIINTTKQAIKELDHIEVESGWYFPSIGEYSSLLEKHGFEVQTALLFDRQTQLKGAHGLRNWVKMFGGNMLSHVTDDLQERVLDRVEELARDHLFQQGHWFADYRRLRITAIHK